MNRKRYQVFVSSTFEDLQSERQHVIQALLELDCIPAGMELFPAADDDQWSLIKNVIDDSDYYVLIVGGRYGSIGPTGKSYTEMEYSYAIEIGKPVLAFLHASPGDLPSSKVESDSSARAQLEQFRALVRQKHCRTWHSPAELGGIVSRSLVQAIKHRPAVGWVKADQPNEATLRELLELRKRVDDAEGRATEHVVGASSVGLSRTVPRQSDFGTESDWLGLLQGAVERVDLMGRALYGWAESTSAFEVIVHKIQNDHVQFRWLVMSPRNPYLDRLTEGDTRIGTAIQGKVHVLSQFLAKIRASLSKDMQGMLQVRYFDRVPLYFGYLRVDERFLVTQYLWSANSGSSPMYCLSDINAAWPKAYSREFETIWRLSPDSGQATTV